MTGESLSPTVRPTHLPSKHSTSLTPYQPRPTPQRQQSRKKKALTGPRRFDTPYSFFRELVPNRRTVQLEYATPISGLASASTYPTNISVGWRFFLNNIYRPYGATIGSITPIIGVKNNSVQEYASLAAMYNKYVVYAAIVELQFHNLGAYALRVSMWPSQDTGAFTSTTIPSDIASRDEVMSRVVPPGALGGAPVITFRQRYSIPRERGLTNPVRDYQFDSANEVAMGSTTTPGSTWLNIACGGLSDSNQGYSIDGFIKITYELVAFDKINETDQPN